MAKDFTGEQLAAIDKIVKASTLDRLYIQDGHLNVTYADGRNVNLGLIQGQDGEDGVSPKLEEVVEVLKPLVVEELLKSKSEFPKGEDGKAPTLDEVVEALLPKIKAPKGEPGKPGIAPTLDEVVTELLKSKSEFPKGEDGKAPTLDEVVAALLPLIDPPKGEDGVSPTVDEVVEALLPKVELPQGPKGEPGLNAPFSTHLKIIDLLATTNQDDPGKQIFEAPVHKFATVTVDIIGVGATSFFSTKKSASFRVDQKITEDQIERATKRSNPEFDVQLIKTASGFGIVVKGPSTEEMEWAGTVVINEIT